MPTHVIQFRNGGRDDTHRYISPDGDTTDARDARLFDDRITAQRWADAFADEVFSGIMRDVRVVRLSGGLACEARMRAALRPLTMDA